MRLMLRVHPFPMHSSLNNNKKMQCDFFASAIIIITIRLASHFPLPRHPSRCARVWTRTPTRLHTQRNDNNEYIFAFDVYLYLHIHNLFDVLFSLRKKKRNENRNYLHSHIFSFTMKMKFFQLFCSFNILYCEINCFLVDAIHTVFTAAIWN